MTSVFYLRQTSGIFSSESEKHFMEGTESALTTTATSGGAETWLTEHFSKRVVVGDAESVRVNLKFALEKLDYSIENEQPSLIAKRKTQLSGYARKLLAGNVLPYVKRLRISFSPLTESSVEIGFNYAVMNTAVTEGNRRTIEAEIEALVALAFSRRLQTVCPACASSNTNAARYCRVCGVPNTSAEPAEIEVLRLTANARAAHQRIVGGLIFTVCWLALFLPLWLLSRQSALAAAIILSGSALFGALWSASGIARLHRAFNPVTDYKPQMLSVAVNAQNPSQISAAQPELLPAQPVSVTEVTTALLIEKTKKDSVFVEKMDTNGLR